MGDEVQKMVKPVFRRPEDVESCSSSDSSSGGNSDSDTNSSASDDHRDGRISITGKTKIPQCPEASDEEGMGAADPGEVRQKRRRKKLQSTLSDSCSSEEVDSESDITPIKKEGCGAVSASPNVGKGGVVQQSCVSISNMPGCSSYYRAQPTIFREAKPPVQRIVPCLSPANIGEKIERVKSDGLDGMLDTEKALYCTIEKLSSELSTKNIKNWEKCFGGKNKYPKWSKITELYWPGREKNEDAKAWFRSIKNSLSEKIQRDNEDAALKQVLSHIPEKIGRVFRNKGLKKFGGAILFKIYEASDHDDFDSLPNIVAKLFLEAYNEDKAFWAQPLQLPKLSAMKNRETRLKFALFENDERDEATKTAQKERFNALLHLLNARLDKLKEEGWNEDEEDKEKGRATKAKVGVHRVSRSEAGQARDVEFDEGCSGVAKEQMESKGLNMGGERHQQSSQTCKFVSRARKIDDTANYRAASVTTVGRNQESRRDNTPERALDLAEVFAEIERLAALSKSRVLADQMKARTEQFEEEDIKRHLGRHVNNDPRLMQLLHASLLKFGDDLLGQLKMLEDDGNDCTATELTEKFAEVLKNSPELTVMSDRIESSSSQSNINQGPALQSAMPTASCSGSSDASVGTSTKLKKKDSSLGRKRASSGFDYSDWSLDGEGLGCYGRERENKRGRGSTKSLPPSGQTPYQRNALYTQSRNEKIQMVHMKLPDAMKQDMIMTQQNDDHIFRESMEAAEARGEDISD